MKEYPRLLVLSNNSLSKSNSNGRTLGSLLQGWPKERLAQFAIMCIDPDFDVCENYYQVRDSEALKSILRGETCVTGINVKSSVSTIQQSSYGKSGKTAMKMLARNAVWNLGRWNGKRFKQWIDDFAPEAVMVQSGDSAFMLRLARKIACRRNIPLLMFNTEGYIFFDHNFLTHYWSDLLFFPIFKKQYYREFKKTIKTTAFAIYANDKLKNDYQSYFEHHADTIYTASSLEFHFKSSISKTPRISYLGNLGIKRPEALVEVGQVLQSISPDLHIDVYGNAKPESINLLNNAPGVEYKGFVSYDRVKEIIYESDILFHVEKNDSVLCKELRYAFSTKIADSICSGTPFVLYAPSHLACSQYVRETGAGWQVSTPVELKAILIEILDSHGIAAVSARAHETATNNHNGIKNAERFRQNVINAFR